jgi:hypothetical protein
MNPFLATIAWSSRSLDACASVVVNPKGEPVALDSIHHHHCRHQTRAVAGKSNANGSLRNLQSMARALRPPDSRKQPVGRATPGRTWKGGAISNQSFGGEMRNALLVMRLR